MALALYGCVLVCLCVGVVCLFSAKIAAGAAGGGGGGAAAGGSAGAMVQSPLSERASELVAQKAGFAAKQLCWAMLGIVFMLIQVRRLRAVRIPAAGEGISDSSFAGGQLVLSASPSLTPTHLAPSRTRSRGTPMVVPGFPCAATTWTASPIAEPFPSRLSRILPPWTNCAWSSPCPRRLCVRWHAYMACQLSVLACDSCLVLRAVYFQMQYYSAEVALRKHKNLLPESGRVCCCVWNRRQSLTVHLWSLQ
jgi:hypothetical protein